MVKDKEVNFENIKWEPLEIAARGKIISPDKCHFSIIELNQTIGIKIYIGEYICNSLGLKINDRVQVYKDPDYEFRFLIAKSDSPSSYKLVKQHENSSFLFFQFKWTGVTKLEKLPTRLAKHKIIRKNQLVIEFYPFEGGQ